MKKDLDKIIAQALTPNFEPDFWLNQKIINHEKEQKQMTSRKNGRVAAATFACIAVLGFSAMTTFAALNYLTPDIVAEKMHQQKLEDAFKGTDAVLVNETQSYGGYNVTFLGVVSGENLIPISEDNSISFYEDKTYAVVAIENADGTPMPDISEDSYSEVEFFVSPLIAGFNPIDYNAATMNGGFLEINEDGILYRIAECDNVEMFADHDLYLCVLDRMFINAGPYFFDEVTGKISRNEDYEGLNALFELPIDAEKADPEKAMEYIESLEVVESDIDKGKLNIEVDEAFGVEVIENNEQGAALAEYALQFVGNPYVWGGDSLTEGTDSSGFTKSVYAHFDISIPHSSAKQREQGLEVNGLENAQPGDLIFYDTPAHVAIYIGDNKIVHAISTYGICISEADFDEIVMIRRMK